MTELLTRVAPTETVLAAPARRPRFWLGSFLPRRPAASAPTRPVSVSSTSITAAGTAGLTVATAGLSLTGALAGDWGYAATLSALVAAMIVMTSGWIGSRRSVVVGVSAAAATGLLGLLALPVLAAVLPGWRSVEGGWFGGAWLDLAAGPLPLASSSRLTLALACAGWGAGVLASIAGLLRVRLLALLPALGLLVLGSLLGTATGWQAAVLATAVAVHLLLGRPGAGLRRAPAATATLLACLLIGLGLPLIAPGAFPGAAPRTLAAQAPTVDVSGSSPLAWVPAWQSDVATDATVFTLAGDPGTAPLRWASLDVYDGTTWSSSATFHLTGPRPAATAGQRLAEDQHTVTVQDLALPGPWLPTPGRAVDVTGHDLLFDSGAGDLAAATIPGSYRVSGRALTADQDSLRAVRQQRADSTTLLAGIDAPAAVAALAHQATAGTTSDLDRLTALATWTQQNVRYNRAAVPGQSVRTLGEVLTGSRDGTMDQVVAGYALMARELGYPSRVVVGFTTSADDPAVHSSDIVAWPEIYLNGVGWQPFYPVPLAGVSDSYDDVVRQQLAETPQSGADGEGDKTSSEPKPAAGHRPTARPAAGHSGWLLAGLAAAMLVATGCLLIIRRRRRYRGSPAQQVLRAWRSLQRQVARGGDTEAGAMTAEEVLHRLAARAEGRPETVAAARELSQLATALVYGGETASAQDARRAWRLADEVRRPRRPRRARGGDR